MVTGPIRRRGWANGQILEHGYAITTPILRRRQAAMDRREDNKPKKRESRTSSRTVASLSADQLERKRANDRESQRLNRQKAKNRLEQLEQEGAELRSQLSDMQIQNDHFRRQNHALETEMRQLREELDMYKRQAGLPGIAESTPSHRGEWYMEELDPQANTRARSAVSSSSRPRRDSQPHGWQSQVPLRATSLEQTSNPSHSTQMNRYGEEVEQYRRQQMDVGSIQTGGNVGLMYAAGHQTRALPPYQSTNSAMPGSYLPNQPPGSLYPPVPPYQSDQSSVPHGVPPYPQHQWPSQAYENIRKGE